MKKYAGWMVVGIVVFASLLRLWKLDAVPVSLFGDELDVGYHAYSILKTGKDYSGNFMPLHLQSLAEWRTPLYLYASVPTVALFGISAYGVRLAAALFGIATIPMFYLLILELGRDQSAKASEGRHRKLIGVALLGALLLTISPWHLEYSRAAFEVTQMLFFLVSGLYLFLRSMRNKGQLLWLSAVSFALMPWAYSTAKFFLPLFGIVLVLLYWRDIFKVTKKNLIIAIVAFAIVGAPITVSTVFGGGAARFGYISVFSDPTTEPEVGTARQLEARIRGELGEGLTPTVMDKLLHNKFTFWGTKIISNYFTAFSTQFLFIDGDPNPRHSIDGIGEMYLIEIVGLLAGVVYLFANIRKKKTVILIAWLLIGVVPSALTRDGGNHATRLILILPPLLILVSQGFGYLFELLSNRFRTVAAGAVVVLMAVSFLSYEHNYWTLNTWQSERWWHYGWQGAIQSMKSAENQFDRIAITAADEPPWIFFAAWSQYDPVKWHAGYPFKKTLLAGFGEVSYIDKYYFGSPADKKGLYDWGKILDEKMLYVASAKEVNVNLIREPERLPADLRLVSSIAFPSGEPAFYLVTHASK